MFHFLFTFDFIPWHEKIVQSSNEQKKTEIHKRFFQWKWLLKSEKKCVHSSKWNPFGIHTHTQKDAEKTSHFNLRHLTNEKANKVALNFFLAIQCSSHSFSKSKEWEWKKINPCAEIIEFWWLLCNNGVSHTHTHIKYILWLVQKWIIRLFLPQHIFVYHFLPMFSSAAVHLNGYNFFFSQFWRDMTTTKVEKEKTVGLLLVNNAFMRCGKQFISIVATVADASELIA